MSEYQRYEFMTSDRPLTQAQLDEVNALSSHIQASSTHALIEYHWSDFKHDPIKVLHKFFDGFLYWANWGCPELALRFPHGVLPADLLSSYDCDDFVTFTRHKDYDILDINFGHDDAEPPNEWIDYKLDSFMSIRDELMDGDMRALYIVWLAAQHIMGSYEEEEYDVIAPPIPPALGKLTAAQRALANLLETPQALLDAAAQHSTAEEKKTSNNIETWIKALPSERRDDYLLRLAKNEPGLSRKLINELRELNQDATKAAAPTGEHVTYATLLAESKVLKVRQEKAERERQEKEYQRHLQDIQDHQESYWDQVDRAVARGSGAGYDEAARILSELRDAANRFQTHQEFQARFREWVQPHLRRTSFMKRLQERFFLLPPRKN